MNPLQLLVSASDYAPANLALEEQLLIDSKEDILLFYINSPSVVIGKHQNPWKEVNINYCLRENIPVVRRLTGGGTVFHDPGNINFCFIRNKKEDLVNFREHIAPIEQALREMGIPCTMNRRNDLFVEGSKVSGNAEHLNNAKKRIIHHGTLLFNAELDVLRQCLKNESYNIETHAVNSVRSPVNNLSNYCSSSNAEDFMNALISQLKKHLKLIVQPRFDPAEKQEIMVLMNERYLQWSWNFGHTPQFVYSTDFGDRITVRKGKIIECESRRLAVDIVDQLIGQVFRPQEIKPGILDNELLYQLILPS